MKIYKIRSYAKINLSLNVIGRLKNSFHKIESLITFIGLHDQIEIKKTKKKNHKILFFGKFSKGISKNNSVLKLLKILDKKKLLKKQKYLVKIKKNIPQKSGMGGGSMNASSILNFFLLKKIIKVSKKEIFKISSLIGSDVILGIEKKNSLLKSSGKILRTNKKIGLYVLIIKPNFGCSTEKIYKDVKHFSKKKFYKNYKKYFLLENIIKLENDLEKISLIKYPKLLNLKLFMEKLPKVKFVRMTGSGSSFVAYFDSRNASLKAFKILKTCYKNYWSFASKTI